MPKLPVVLTKLTLVACRLPADSVIAPEPFVVRFIVPPVATTLNPRFMAPFPAVVVNVISSALKIPDTVMLPDESNCHVLVLPADEAFTVTAPVLLM